MIDTTMASLLAAIPEVVSTVGSIAEGVSGAADAVTGAVDTASSSVGNAIGSVSNAVSGIGSSLQKMSLGSSNDAATNPSSSQSKGAGQPLRSRPSNQGSASAPGPQKRERREIFKPTQSNNPPTDFGNASNFFMSTNEPGPTSASPFFNFNPSPNPGQGAITSNMQTIFSRPYFVGTTNWTVGLAQGAVLANIAYPSEFTAEALAPHGVLSYQKQLRAGISLMAMVNPTPFQQGQLIVCFYPGDPPRTQLSFAALTVLPHGLINLGVSNSCSIHVPYTYWKAAFDTTLKGEIMGHLLIACYNPLRAGTDDQQTLPVTVWFQFTDPQPFGQTAFHAPFVDVPQSSDSEEEMDFPVLSFYTSDEDADDEESDVESPPRKKKCRTQSGFFDGPEPDWDWPEMDPEDEIFWEDPVLGPHLEYPVQVNLFGTVASDYSSEVTELDDSVYECLTFTSQDDAMDEDYRDLGLGGTEEEVMPNPLGRERFPSLTFYPNQHTMWRGCSMPPLAANVQKLIRANPHVRADNPIPLQHYIPFEDLEESGGVASPHVYNPTYVFQDFLDEHQADNQARQVTDMAPAAIVDAPSLAFTESEEPREMNATNAVPLADWSFHLSTHCLLNTVTWSTTQSPGTVLAARPIFPNMWLGDDFSASGWANAPQPTTLSAISSMYYYWRGTIDLLIQPICTRMHRGRLLLYYLPGGFPIPNVGDIASLQTFASAYTWSYDIGTQTMFPVSIPYISATDWTPFLFYNGVFVIQVQTQLAARAGTPTTIEVNVWTRAGDDFELSVPTDSTLQTNTEGTGQIPKPNFYQSSYSVIGGDEVNVPPTTHFQVDERPAPTRYVTQPEGPNSLLSRWNLIDTRTILADTVPPAADAFMAIPSQPNQWAFWQRAETSFAKFELSYSHLAPLLFGFYRGGLNVRVCTNANLTNSSNCVVQLSPATGGYMSTPITYSSGTGSLFVNLSNQPTFNFQIPYYSAYSATPTNPEGGSATRSNLAIFASLIFDTKQDLEVQVYAQVDRDAMFMFPLPPPPILPNGSKVCITSQRYNSSIATPSSGYAARKETVHLHQMEKGSDSVGAPADAKKWPSGKPVLVERSDGTPVRPLKKTWSAFSLTPDLSELETTAAFAAVSVENTCNEVTEAARKIKPLAQNLSEASEKVGKAADALASVTKQAEQTYLSENMSESVHSTISAIKTFFSDDNEKLGLGVCLIKLLLYGAQAYTTTTRMQGGLLAAQFLVDCAVHIPKMKKYAGVVTRMFSDEAGKDEKETKVDQHQGLSDMTPALAWDMVTSSFCLTGDREGFFSACRNINVVSQAAKGIEWFFEKLILCVKKCIDWFAGRGKQVSFWVQNVDVIARWVANVAELKQHTMPSLRNTPKLREQLRKCYEQSQVLRKAAVIHPHPPQPLIPTCNLVDEMNRAVTHGTASGRRPEPLVVYLAGDPGVGKSLLMGTIVEHLAKHMNVDPETASWSRNACSKYYDGYFQQPIVLIDDVGASAESNCWDDFMNMISTAQFLPNMAALPEKGIYFTSKIVICSSNIMYPAPNSITCHKALLRRLHVAVKVEPADNFAVPLDVNTQKLDYHKAEGLGALKDGSAWKLTLYDAVTKQNRGELTLKELLDMVTRDYDQRFPDSHQAGEMAYGCSLCGWSGESYESLIKHQTKKHEDEFKSLIGELEKAEGLSGDMQMNVLLAWTSNVSSVRVMTKEARTIKDKLLEYYDSIFSDRSMKALAAITMIVSIVATSWFTYKLWTADKALANVTTEDLNRDSAELQGDAARGRKTDPKLSSKVQKDVATLENKLEAVREALDVDEPQGVYNANSKKSKGKKGVATMQAANIDYTSLGKNVVRVHVMGESQNNVYGLGLVDDFCLIPKHAVMQFDDPTIELLYPSGRSHQFKYSDVKHKRIKAPEEGATASDCLLIRVPNPPQKWGSILHRIHHGELAHRGFPGVLMTSSHRPTLLSVAGIQPRVFAVQQEEVEYIRGFMYAGPCAKGMCGAMLISLVDTMQNAPVLGFHTAGSDCRGDSESLSLSWLKEAMSEMQDPHEVQCLNSDVEVIRTGISPPLYQPLKSDFRESPLADVFPNERAPAALHPNDHRVMVTTTLDAMYTAKFKKVHEKKPPRFEDAVSHLTMEFQKLFGVQETQVYDLKRALCGTKACLNALNLKTSAGYPWCKQSKKKKQLLGYEGMDDWDTCIWWVDEEVREDMLRIELGGDVIWCTAFKDELRPLAKVSMAKTRTIDTPPVSYTLLFRQEFGMFMDLYVQHYGVKAHHAIGCDPEKDFTAFWTDLVDASVTGFACDFSGFDASVPVWALEGALQVMSLGKPTHRGRVLFESIINTKHHFRDKMILARGGVPSGTPATSTINSVVHSLLAMTAWLELQPGERPLSEMKWSTKFITYGDDGVFATCDPWYTPERLQEWYAGIGMTFTPAVKTSDFSGFEPLESLSFLKRTNQWVAGLAHPAIEMATIHSLFNWVRKDTDLQEYVDEAFGFLYHHGKKKYSEYATIVQGAIVKRGLDVSIPSFESWDRNFQALHGRDIN
uniref:Genome polyprotein n=1 Tax=Guangxi changeable lizard picornavirus 1 TaxID=2116183 RepID=A0A2P1GN54_9VIRU|nr:polyprotein [Guangxi changeable lizard picornavirus 1]